MHRHDGLLLPPVAELLATIKSGFPDGVSSPLLKSGKPTANDDESVANDRKRRLRSGVAAATRIPFASAAVRSAVTGRVKIIDARAR